MNIRFRIHRIKAAVKKFDKKYLKGSLLLFVVNLLRFLSYLKANLRIFSRKKKLPPLKADVRVLAWKSIGMLTILNRSHGSDKGVIQSYGSISHDYTEYYSTLFDHCREKIRLVFECGIGSVNPNLVENMHIYSGYKPGASLRLWQEYFFNAQIYGADIDEKILFSDERIKTFHVDQQDPATIKQMWQKIGVSNFDLIIDDGFHNLEANISLFKHSYDKLKSGGIYIIEDVGVTYIAPLMDSITEISGLKPGVFISNNESQHLVEVRKTS